MSLDVYLERAGVSEPRERIMIRESGGMKEITREEWGKKYPGRVPVIFHDDGLGGTVFEYNVTHNLNTMAREAGIYKHLWRPEEVGATVAVDLIAPLLNGLDALKCDRERFKKLNPENGWGDYEGLVEFVEKYLEACKKYPDATIRVWR